MPNLAVFLYSFISRLYVCFSRPVSALYEIEVKSVDQSKKGKIIQDYIVFSLDFLLFFSLFHRRSESRGNIHWRRRPSNEALNLLNPLVF